jgi:hypothetical protein
MKLDANNYTEEEIKHRALRIETIAKKLKNKSSYINQMRNKNNGFTKPMPKTDTVFMRSINKLNNEGTFNEKVAFLFPSQPAQAERFANFYKAKYSGEKDMYTLYNMVHDKLMTQFSKVQASADLVFKTVVKMLNNFDQTGSFEGSVSGVSAIQSTDGSVFQLNHNEVDKSVDEILAQEQTPVSSSRNDPNPEVTNNFGTTDQSVAPVSNKQELEEEEYELVDSYFGGDAGKIVDAIDIVKQSISLALDIGFKAESNTKMNVTRSQFPSAMHELSRFINYFHRYDDDSYKLLHILILNASNSVQLYNAMGKTIKRASKKEITELTNKLNMVFSWLKKINDFALDYDVDKWIPMFMGTDDEKQEVFEEKEDDNVSVMSDDEEFETTNETKGEPANTSKVAETVFDDVMLKSDEVTQLLNRMNLAVTQFSETPPRRFKSEQASTDEKAYYKRISKDTLKEVNGMIKDMYINKRDLFNQWANLFYAGNTSVYETAKGVSKNFGQVLIYHVMNTGK